MTPDRPTPPTGAGGETKCQQPQVYRKATRQCAGDSCWCRGGSKSTPLDHGAMLDVLHREIRRIEVRGGYEGAAA